MSSGRWDQNGNSIQALHSREDQRRLPVGSRFGQVIDEGLAVLEPLETFSGEQGPRTITQQTFQASAVESADAHVGIEGEATAMGPREPVFGRLGIEALPCAQTTATDVCGCALGRF